MPNGWKRKQVGDLCDFVNGHGFKASDWSERGLPIIRIQNLNGSKSYNYYKGPPPTKRIIVQSGDLLFAWAGVKGVSFGPKIWNGPTGLLNQHIYKIVPKKHVDTFWLYSILRMLTINIEASAHGFKSSLLHVKKADIAEHPVHVPELNEQQAITEVLSTWDRAIEKIEALIKAKERRKKGLMQQLLTGRVRFGEFVKSEGKRKTSHYDLPEDWNYPTIDEVAKQVSVKNTSGTALPVLSCTKHAGLVDSLTYFGKQVFSKDLSTYKVVPKGAFAYATNHIEEGSIGFQGLYEKAVISPMYTVFKTTKAVHDGFLFKLLKTEWYRTIFEVRTSASVDRRGSLRWKEFAKIRIPLPELPEQEKISGIIDVADSEIQRLNDKLSALKEQKKGLMQQLLIGKVRVKGANHG